MLNGRRQYGLLLCPRVMELAGNSEQSVVVIPGDGTKWTSITTGDKSSCAQFRLSLRLKRNNKLTQLRYLQRTVSVPKKTRNGRSKSAALAEDASIGVRFPRGFWKNTSRRLTALRITVAVALILSIS